MKTLLNKLSKYGRWRAGILIKTELLNTGNARRSYTKRFRDSSTRIREQIKMVYNREEVCGRGS